MVQKSNFLRLYAYKTNMLNLNINKVANLEGLKSLKTRRLIFDVTFIYKLLNGDIDCPELFQQISLKVPSFNSKNNSPFAIPQSTKNIFTNSPL